MPIAEDKKNKIRQYIYNEVMEKLEKCFRDLSVAYMPIHSAYSDCADFLPRSNATPLLNSIEIVLEKNNYNKVIHYLDGLPVASKTVLLDYKCAYDFFLEAVNVMRVDIYNTIPFPGGYVIKSEELFSHGIKRNESNLILPSPEHALMFLICRFYHYSDQFSNPARCAMVQEIASSNGFSWNRLWDLAGKTGMKRYLFYFLKVFKTAQDVEPLQGSTPIYPALLGSKLVQACYKFYPRIVKKIFFKAFLIDNPLKYSYIHSLHGIARNSNTAGNAIYKTITEIIARKYIVDNEIYVFNAVTGSVKSRYHVLDPDYRLEEELILGTSSGIWYMREGVLYQLTCGSTYGITYDGEKWYASQGLGQYSRIISFCVTEAGCGAAIKSVEGYIKGLPRNIHQIEFYDGRVYAADTHNNRIITIDRNKKIQYYFPNRAIRNNKNNNHFNSIYITHRHVYLCAHNGTLASKRNSEIFILDRNTMKLCEIINTEASCAHNIVYHDGTMLYCDSAAGRLLINGSSVFEDKRYFMRGLAFTRKYVIAGGSQFARRDERQGTDSVVHVLDKDFVHQHTIALHGIGQLYEIRGVANDKGLSINVR